METIWAGSRSVLSKVLREGKVSQAADFQCRRELPDKEVDHTIPDMDSQ
jgi:hypothetical protein